MKGEGNQQDYGMRIYDPRIAKFLSADPLSADYPELAQYQFASNRPISALDLDGLEAKDLARELEPVRAQRERERIWGITYPETTKQKYLRYFVTGGLGLTALAPMTAAAISGLTIATQATITNVILWASNPANQGIVLLFAEGALELINPDPGYDIDLTPGPGGEMVKAAKLLFRTKSKKIVEAIFEDGAKFENLSELDWFEKLLAEGNDIKVFKKAETNSVQSADFFVNGIKTEIKEIAQVTSPDLGRNIKTTIEGAMRQAKNGGNIIIDVTKQQGATKEFMENVVERVKGNASYSTTYRIVGKGFELTGEIKSKKP